MSEQFHNQDVSLQSLIEENSGSHLKLPNREFSAPIVINNPITIEGSPNATIWSMHGPAIEIKANDIKFKNLRIEITNGTAQNELADVAILASTSQKVTFENVEIRGRVIGIVGEEGHWRIPNHLNLGWIEPNKDLFFSMEMDVPCDCNLISEISGCTLSTTKLHPGINRVNFEIEALSRDILISGFFSIKTSCFIRKISLTGHSLSEFAPDDCILTSSGSLIWTCNPTSQDELQSVENDKDDVIAHSLPQQETVTLEESSEPLNPELILPAQTSMVSIPNLPEQSVSEGVNLLPSSSLSNADTVSPSVPIRERKLKSQPIDFPPNSPFSLPIQPSVSSKESAQNSTSSPENIQPSQNIKTESTNIRDTSRRRVFPIVIGGDSPFSIPNQEKKDVAAKNPQETELGSNSSQKDQPNNSNPDNSDSSNRNQERLIDRKVKKSSNQISDIFKQKE
jgi:hypothetical protein